MLSRTRAVLVVALLVATIGGFPGLMPTARAEPRTITVAVYDEPPFVITRDHIKTGFTIDLLEEIAKRTGWHFNYVETGATNSKGLLAAVAAGRADAAATSITITAERRRSFDFSQPTLDSGTQIAVSAASVAHSTPGLVSFLKLLFSRSMLIWLAAAVFLALVPAHIIWLLERRTGDSMVAESYFPGIFQSFRWALGMLAATYDEEPRHGITSVVAVLWGFVSVIFVAFFTATLTANLTVDKIEAQVKSTADLVNKKVCTVAETTTAKYLKRVGLRFEGVAKVEDCFAKLEHGATDAIVYDAPILAYWVAHDGEGVAQLSGAIFNRDTDGIALPAGSDLRNPIDEALLAIKESGDYGLIKQKWFGSDE